MEGGSNTLRISIFLVPRFYSSFFIVITIQAGNSLGKTSEEIIERSRGMPNAEMKELMKFVREPPVHAVHRSCH